MPLVDDEDRPIDLSVPWSFQDEQAQERTLALIDLYREEIEDEDGGFNTRPLTSGRVLLELAQGDALVAYLADTTDRNAQLVLDDLPFEIWSEWVTQSVTEKTLPIVPSQLGGST